MRIKLPRGPRVNIKVTEGIIKDSIKADSSHCMIAEAVRKAVPHAKSVSVDIQTIRFSDPGRRLRFTYLTPRIAQVPILEFDQGIEPSPFDFMLSGAQVTRMSHSNAHSAVEGSDPSKIAKAKEVHAALAKTRLIRPEGGAFDSVPVRIGGRTPPKTAFANRRAFGLRLLGRPPVAEQAQ